MGQSSPPAHEELEVYTEPAHQPVALPDENQADHKEDRTIDDRHWHANQPNQDEQPAKHRPGDEPDPDRKGSYNRNEDGHYYHRLEYSIVSICYPGKFSSAKEAILAGEGSLIEGFDRLDDAKEIGTSKAIGFDQHPYLASIIGGLAVNQ